MLLYLVLVGVSDQVCGIVSDWKPSTCQSWVKLSDRKKPDLTDNASVTGPIRQSPYRITQDFPTKPNLLTDSNAKGHSISWYDWGNKYLMEVKESWGKNWSVGTGLTWLEKPCALADFSQLLWSLTRRLPTVFRVVLVPLFFCDHWRESTCGSGWTSIYCQQRWRSTMRDHHPCCWSFAEMQ